VAIACPLQWPPREVGSVVRIPAHMMARAMAPVIEALCECTRPGEYADVMAKLDFAAGRATVTTPANAAIDGCVQTVQGSFEPFPEAQESWSDCIGCGPRRYGVFRGSLPADTREPGGLRMVYGFKLDRSPEILHCDPGMLAIQGRCVPEPAPPSLRAAPSSCGCTPLDLKCAIGCAATQP
jgi:hypothetical protein